MIRGSAYFIFFIFSVCLAYGQTRIYTSNKPLYTYNAARNEFFVLDDSLQYHTFNLKRKKWESKAFVYNADLSFDDFKINFAVLPSEKHGYFFVDRGCGIVYELNEDTLKRIDDSFAHKNQYDACIFIKKDTIFFFGGYGLFTFKNILTFFDYNAKQWFEKFPNSHIKPEPCSSSHFYVDENNFYLTGGISGNSLKERHFNDVWKLNFSTNTWQKLGNYNSEIKSLLNIIYDNRTHMQKYVAVNGSTIFEFDFNNNKYKKYWNESFADYLSLIPSNTNLILSFKMTPLRDKHFLSVENKNVLFAKPLKTGFIYQKENKSFIFNWNYLHLVLYGSLVLLLAFLIFQRYRLQSTNNSVYKDLSLASFNDVERDVLEFLFSKRENPIPISDLNHFFDEDGISFEALKKRREALIKQLKFKLSTVSGLKSEETILETKNPLDKRIKEVQLNKLLIFSDLQPTQN